MDDLRLVEIDIKMPKIDGIEVLRRVYGKMTPQEHPVTQRG